MQKKAIVKVDSNKLTTVETASLKKCEAIIEKGLKTFIEVGRALMEIRNDRLYRATHKTFEAYCQAKFALKRERAYELINASETANSLPKEEANKLTESTAKVLKKVPANKRAEILSKAEKAAKAKGKVIPTAKDVKEAATGKKIIKGNFRKDATNQKGNILDYSLANFRKDVLSIVKDYRAHNLPVSTIIVELDSVVSSLRAEKANKAS